MVDLASDLHINGDILLTVVPHKVADSLPGNASGTVADATDLVELFFAQLRALNATNVVAVTSSEAATRKLGSLNISATEVPLPVTGHGVAVDLSYGHVKTAALRALLAAGFSVLYADVDVLFLKPPFGALYRDSDFEAASGDDT